MRFVQVGCLHTGLPWKKLVGSAVPLPGPVAPPKSFGSGQYLRPVPPRHRYHLRLNTTLRLLLAESYRHLNENDK